MNWKEKIMSTWIIKFCLVAIAMILSGITNPILAQKVLPDSATEQSDKHMIVDCNPLEKLYLWDAREILMFDRYGYGGIRNYAAKGTHRSSWSTPSHHPKGYRAQTYFQRRLTSPRKYP